MSPKRAAIQRMLLAVSLGLCSGCSSGEFFWRWDPRAFYRSSSDIAAGACYDNPEEQAAVGQKMNEHWGPSTGVQDAVPSLGCHFRSTDAENEKPEGMFTFQ